MLKGTETQTAPASSIILSPSRRPLRIWPAVLMLAVFWAFLIAHYTFEMDMFPRFMSRMIAYGLLLIGFLTWWLTRRQIGRRDRWLAVGVVVVTSIVAALLADASVNLFVLFMTAFPFIFTAWAVWIIVAKNRSIGLQRAGFIAVIGAVTGFFSLLRWDGLYGNQIPQFSWRWTKTAEELFDSEHAAAASLSANRPTHEWTIQPGDWPEFRGPNRDSVITGTKLDTDWTANPPKLLWQQRVGPAWSSMIVVDGFLVTQEQRGEQEAIVCYEAATGKEVWSHTDQDRFFEGLSGVGPRSTPTFANGRIFTLGANGRLSCLSPTTGKPIWSRDVIRDAGGEIPQWGYSVSPLVVDGKVIAFAGGKDQKSLGAYDAATGEPLWTQAGGNTTYSSPQLVLLSGERQILMHDNRALAAVRLEDGAILWQRPNANKYGFPMLQPRPIADDKLLFATEPGIALLSIERDGDRWTSTDQWSARSLKPSFNDFVVHEGHIYGLDDGILVCVDLESGRRLWKKGRYGHGQILLLADQGLLIIATENGEVALVEIAPERPNELGRFQAIEGKTWNHPVFAHGKLFVRNGEEMACYELRRLDQ